MTLSFHSLYDMTGLDPHVDFFLFREQRGFPKKILEQGYVKIRLKSSLKKFYGRYGDLIKQYEVPPSRMFNDNLKLSHIQWHPQTFHRTLKLLLTWPFTELREVSMEQVEWSRWQKWENERRDYQQMYVIVLKQNPCTETSSSNRVCTINLKPNISFDLNRRNLFHTKGGCNFSNWPSSVGPQLLFNRTFLCRCLCCHFALLTFLLV